MLRILSFLLSAPCLIPVGAILIWTLPELGLRTTPSLAEPAGDLDLPAWLFLLYTRDTVSLLGLTCLMAALIAFPLAWFTSFFQFPFQRFLGLFSFLPFAFPPYIVAFCWADFLDYAGPVQTLWRELNNYDQASEYYFFPIRSLGGAAWVFALCLYPYLYLTLRLYFASQSRVLFESGQVLGLKPRQIFFRLVLPKSRPALLAGLFLIMLETLNDYGVANLFGIGSLSQAVFDGWLLTGNFAQTSRIASLLLLVVFLILALEEWNRRDRHYFHVGEKFPPVSRRLVRGWTGLGVSFLCFLPGLAGFVFPIVWLVRLLDFSALDYPSFFTALYGSASLGLLGGLLTVSVCLLFCYEKRWHDRSHKRRRYRWVAPASLGRLGYAMPGAVLGIGLLIASGWVDRHGWALWQGLGLTFSLAGSLPVLLLAYGIRFGAVALGSLQPSLDRLSTTQDDAALMLGYRRFSIARRIHLPQLWPSLAVALSLIFVEIIKELPATLILRPLSLETLAIQSFAFASDERFNQAALPALTVAFLGLGPVLFLTHGFSEKLTARQTRPPQVPPKRTELAPHA